MEGCLILVPEERVPKSVVHFVGGFLAGSNLQIGYSSLLLSLCRQGHLVIATPIPAFETNHLQVTNQIGNLFTNCYYRHILPNILGPAAEDVPIIGLSHSLGGKLTVLLNSQKKYRKRLPKRIGNVFLAFNNYSLKNSIDISLEQTAKLSPEMDALVEKLKNPMLESVWTSIQSSDLFGNVLDNFKKISSSSYPTEVIDKMRSDWWDVGNDDAITEDNRTMKVMGKNEQEINDLRNNFEFVPSSSETWNMLVNSYNVQSNVFLKFNRDTIDQSDIASQFMQQRGCDTIRLTIDGNHITPNYIQPKTNYFENLLESQMEREGMGGLWDEFNNRIEDMKDGNVEMDSANIEFRLMTKEVLKTLNQLCSDHASTASKKTYLLPDGRIGRSGENGRWDVDDM